jgi:hypothetical protein
VQKTLSSEHFAPGGFELAASLYYAYMTPRRHVVLHNDDAGPESIVKQAKALLGLQAKQEGVAV